MSKINGFQDLNCWKEGRELWKMVSNLIREFPGFENYSLISQMRRASRSVTHNIAEGYGRFHYGENIQFCRISRGSLHELEDQLITALDEKYITENQFANLKKQISNCLALLNGYINYLRKAKENR